MSLLIKFISYFFTDKKVKGFMAEPATPEIISCNKFLVGFCKSGIAEIEVSEQAIVTNRLQLSGDLAGIPFDRIRNRFRVLSNLDPLKNKKDEMGRLKLSYKSGAEMVDVDLLTLFPADTARFTIRKIELV